MFFLVTNGRSFALYRTSRLDEPVMSWRWEDIEEIFLALSNIVGPDAIKRKLKHLAVDAGKPLGQGVASTVQIIGGHVRYEDHESNNPLLDMEAINGLELPVTGGQVTRSADGRLHAQIKMAKAAPLMGDLSELLEREDGYDFYCSDEFISVDRAAPSIFQNFYSHYAPAGTEMTIPGLGKLSTPFDFRFTALTEAVGFLEGDNFNGTMQLAYEFKFEGMQPLMRAALEAQFGRFPEVPRAQGGGTFEVRLLNL